MTEKPYKIRVVGIGGVGKSALTVRFMKGEFDNCQEFPILEKSYTKDIELDDGKEVTLVTVDILDLQDDPENLALSENYMRNGDGFLLVYSLTDMSSFEDINKFYQQILMTKSADNVPMVLVGNKCDLENERVVEESEGQRVSQDYRIPYREVSAKEDVAVEEAFVELVREIQKDRENKRRENEEAQNHIPPTNNLPTNPFVWMLILMYWCCY